MNNLKIFIASSSELKEEREQLEILIYRMNSDLVNKKDLFLEPVVWENLRHSFHGDRIQDYFSEEMLKCQIVIFLFWKKVGDYTYEEFKTAYDAYVQKKYPKYVYVYFKDFDLKFKSMNEDLLKVYEMRNKIQRYEQIYTDFESIDSLKYKFKDQLVKAIDHYYRNERLDNQVKKIRTDFLELLNQFKRQFSIILFRFNPIKSGVYAFTEALEELKDDADNDEIVTCVGNAINSADLDTAISGVKEFTKGYTESIYESFTFRNFFKDDFNTICANHKSIDDIEDEISRLTLQVEELINSHSKELDEIHSNYNQLKEYFPRYKKILTRSGLLDFLVGVASGIFLGGIGGVVGALAWGGWRESSDKEFIKLFSSAFQNFNEKAYNLLVKLEEEIEILFDNFIVKYDKLFDKCLDEILEQPNSERIIQQLYDSIYSESENIDDDTKKLIEQSIEELKDNKVFNHSKEIRLRELLEI